MRHVVQKVLVAALSTLGAVTLAEPSHACTPGGSDCPSGQVCSGTSNYSWVPGYVTNAARGDLGFRTPTAAEVSNDLISTILEYMGQQRSHVVMFTNSGCPNGAPTCVRHNTRAVTADELQVNDASHPNGKVYNRYGGWGSCEPGDVYVDPNWLKYGGPGDGLQTSDAYAIMHDPGYTTTVVNAIGLSSNVSYVQAAASRMEGMYLGYRLYAYSHEDNAYALGADMCSGSILEASRAAPNGFWNWWYDPTTKTNIVWNNAAANPVRDGNGNPVGGLYPALVTWVNNYLNSIGKGCMTSTGTWALAMGIARQVVNCFAYDGCGLDPNGNLWAQNNGDFASGWNATAGNFHFLDGGYSVSPDNLIWEVNTGSTNYNRTEQPATFDGAYWNVTTTYACTPTCGDGTCDFGESCRSCPTDCGECPPPPPPPPPHNCFVAGTPITLADGVSTKPIEQILVGDQVLAYDTERGEDVPGDVVHLFVHPHTTRLVQLNGLTTTPEHRFYANGRWIAAMDLAPGDQLLAIPRSNERELVTTGELMMMSGDTTTYNFEVAGYHDYFAGGVLVHNLKCTDCQTP